MLKPGDLVRIVGEIGKAPGDFRGGYTDLDRYPKFYTKFKTAGIPLEVIHSNKTTLTIKIPNHLQVTVPLYETSNPNPATMTWDSMGLLITDVELIYEAL